MGHQLQLFGENPNARVIMREGSRIVIAVEGAKRRQRIVMDTAELPEQMAERMRPGTWLRVERRRKGERRLRILDEHTQPAAS